MSFPTVGQSLSPVSGKLSSNSSMSQSASPRGITPWLTARLSRRFRILRDLSGSTVMTTSTAGTTSSCGQSMHKFHSSRPPQASPLSSAYSATNPLCFTGQKSFPTLQLLITGSEWARKFGTQLSAETQDLCTCPPVFHPIYFLRDKVWLEYLISDTVWRKYPGWTGMMCWNPLSWPSFSINHPWPRGRGQPRRRNRASRAATGRGALSETHHSHRSLH